MPKYIQDDAFTLWMKIEDVGCFGIHPSLRLGGNLRVPPNLLPQGQNGVKVDFPVFTYLIRAAGYEQEEKTGPKSDLAFLRYRTPNIEVYM